MIWGGVDGCARGGGHDVLHNKVVAAAAASVPMCDFMVGVMDLNSDEAVKVQL